MADLYAIITAAGAGTRMQSSLPKQFMDIYGKPMLLITISRFLQFDEKLKIIVVIPRDQWDTWNQISEKYGLHSIVTVTEGGPTRFHSVKNGLKLVPHNAIVGIHDGVRPLVSLETIRQAYHYAQKFGNAIPAIPVTESVRWIDNAINKPINRNQIKIIQTPQCFRAHLIKDAYNVNYMEEFTDDASVLEKAGFRIYLSEGNKENIKITSPEDLVFAKAIMHTQNRFS